jgi:hypothetical protein
MPICTSRRVLIIVHCLGVLSIGRFTFAQSSRDDHTQQDNSDGINAKRKLKGGKRAAGKSKHPGVTIGHALSIDFTGRIEGDLRQATPALGFDAAQPEWQDRRVGVKKTAFERVSFEVSRELGQDFETTIGLSEKTAWRDFAE